MRIFSILLISLLIAFSSKRAFGADMDIFAGTLELTPGDLSYGKLNSVSVGAGLSHTFKNRFTAGLEANQLSIYYGKNETANLDESYVSSDYSFYSDAKITGVLYAPYFELGYEGKNYNFFGKLRASFGELEFSGSTVSHEKTPDIKLTNTYSGRADVSSVEYGIRLGVIPSKGFEVSFEYLTGFYKLMFNDQNVSREIPEADSFSDEMYQSLRDELSSQSMRLALSFELF